MRGLRRGKARVGVGTVNSRTNLTYQGSSSTEEDNRGAVRCDQ